jgi:hypothetical protein
MQGFLRVYFGGKTEPQYSLVDDTIRTQVAAITPPEFKEAIEAHGA